MRGKQVNNAETDELHPYFSGKAVVNIALAADDGYAPHLATMLASIKAHATRRHKYDIVVMTNNMSEDNRRRLQKMMKRSNIALRFFDVNPYMAGRTDVDFTRTHITVQTLYRLLMQDIFPEWDKVLYLDCDMVALRDVAELFDTDITGCLLAATYDADMAGHCGGFLPERNDYLHDVLGMKDVYAYFQAGVLVFNLAEFRRRFSVEELFAYVLHTELQLFDQDALNHFCEGHVRYVTTQWNVMMDFADIRVGKIIVCAPDFIRDDYMNARKDPYIVHYAGPLKPWDIPDVDFGPLYWQYAKLTPYFAALDEPFRIHRENMRAERRLQKKVARQKKRDVIYERMFPKGTRRRRAITRLYRACRKAPARASVGAPDIAERDGDIAEGK